MKQHALFLCLSLILASCASAPSRIDITSLKNLFRVCESDLGQAGRVIVERDLIKHLAHLQRMDDGGSKYYLLERDAITAMIKAVTDGVYADFILVAEDGRVVYTMTDNGLFARSVRSARGADALAACHARREPGPYIVTVPSLPARPDASFLAVSSPVSGGDTMPGTFILMVDMEKIRRLVGKSSCIIGPNGVYEASCCGGEIHTPYADFDRIDLSGSRNGIVARRFERSSGGSAEYRLFSYANLFWILVTE
ncbi:MAG: hypothetical protein JW807_02130 [Spirochaetes bacterium]|nr:hypothetical protein [Spirochaetota bacterium]